MTIRLRRKAAILLAPLFALFAVALPARATEDVANFYRGKQARFIVGSAPGGTYDILARMVARHVGAHIPGTPLVIVQNQPTAGGIVMADQLYALGPKDGTVIGVPLNGIPAAPLFGRTEYRRPYFLPPEVPADRVAALRRAFDATMKDDAFTAEAAKIGFAVDPLTGEQVQKLVADLASLAPPTGGLLWHQPFQTISDTV